MTDPLTTWRIKLRDEPGRADFYMSCPHGRSTGGTECKVSLWQRPAEGVTWQWDGNVQAPTITPSIDCHGGCGRHFTMIGGVPK